MEALEVSRHRADRAQPRPLYAYHASIPGARLPEITPSPRWREWMNGTHSRFANRCLPLLVANESGWVIRNPIAFEAAWDGGEDRSAVTIELDGDRVTRSGLVESLFGYGILTWTIPYLFRTPAGYDLLARGPANWPKDGLCALEGLVETDWATATFTMNWKFTRPGLRVRFDAGEPFCMIVPQRRGELEEFTAEIRHVRADPATAEGWRQWTRSRDELQVRKFLGLYSDEFREAREEWEQDYFRGRGADGRPAPEHRTKRHLSGFRLVD